MPRPWSSTRVIRWEIDAIACDWRWRRKLFSVSLLIQAGSLLLKPCLAQKPAQWFCLSCLWKDKRRPRFHNVGGFTRATARSDSTASDDSGVVRSHIARISSDVFHCTQTGDTFFTHVRFPGLEQLLRPLSLIFLPLLLFLSTENLSGEDKA